MGLDWLGEAHKVVIDKDNTTIVEKVKEMKQDMGFNALSEKYGSTHA